MQRELDGFRVESLDRGASVLRERFSLALDLLAGSAGLLLLLVCSNVAGLRDRATTRLGKRRRITTRLWL